MHDDSLHAAAAAQHARERRNDALLHWLMFGVLMLTVPAFYLQLEQAEPPWHLVGPALYALVAVAFFFDLMHHRATRRSQDHDRMASLWLDVGLIAGAAASAVSSGGWSPVEWALRSALLLVVVLRMLIFLRRLFSPHNIVYLVALGAGMLAMAGAGFYWLEPTVHSYADGLWLAFESGATVGYGDIVPTTPASRLFAAFMVLLGFAMLSLVTGAIAAAFVGEDERKLRHELHADIKALRLEVQALRSALSAGGASAAREQQDAPP
jgi:voltage-gated potassium channel